MDSSLWNEVEERRYFRVYGNQLLYNDYLYTLDTALDTIT
jgi:hypothetical protein